MTHTQSEREEQIKQLREWLKPGDTVYTVLRHVSKSGMTRHISVVLLNSKNGEVTDLHPNYAISMVLGYPLANGHHDAIKVSGCGMDMGFEIVYNLGRTLWPGGNGKYKTGRNGMKEPETDGGYLLNHRWL